jgi:hypothetical protein
LLYNLPYLPLFMLDVKTDGGVLDYSDTPRSSSPASRSCSTMPSAPSEMCARSTVSVALAHHPLCDGEDEVRDLHDGLVAQAGDSIVALAEFLDSMRAHEELLQRDEAGYVRARLRSLSRSLRRSPS